MDARADMARKLTPEEAHALFESGWWKKMDQAEVARLQLSQDRLCMHAVPRLSRGDEKLLGRPVFTHEFVLGRDALIAEADGKRDAPLSPLHSLAEIVVPEKAAKAIVIKV